jgi:hypothetical protein
VISGDTLVDFGRGLEINERWLRPGVTREEMPRGCARCAACGAFAEPSDGLEPSTPRLTIAPSQTVATVRLVKIPRHPRWVCVVGGKAD